MVVANPIVVPTQTEIDGEVVVKLPRVLNERSQFCVPALQLTVAGEGD